MNDKAQKLVKNWSKPVVTEGRTQITLRVEFDLYAKLHALKVAFPSRSVNELMNDLLINGIDEVIEGLGDSQEGGREAFDDDGQYLGVTTENRAYTFERAYSMILEEGKDSDLLKDIKGAE